MEEEMEARSLRRLAFAGALVIATLVIAAPLGAAERNAYVVTNLVSDNAAVPAASHDASLVNGWGLTSSSSSPWWVSDNGANVSTLYNGNTGAKVPLTVVVDGGPTGTVFNIAGAGFAVPSGPLRGSCSRARTARSGAGRARGRLRRRQPRARFPMRSTRG